MTKEKLEKEAYESAKKFFGKSTDLVDLDNLRIFKNGYLAGAEPRENLMEMREKETQILFLRLADRGRRIQILEQRIEQLKKDVVENESDCANCGLRQENIELKKELKDTDEKVVHLACNQNKDLKYKLTKATEIIYRLMDIINHDLKCFDTIAGFDVKQKAMEFLKEQKINQIDYFEVTVEEIEK